MPLRKVTPAEITATRLRKMARDLILEAEALEATAPSRPRTGANNIFKDPLTGKVTRIKKVEML